MLNGKTLMLGWVVVAAGGVAAVGACSSSSGGSGGSTNTTTTSSPVTTTTSTGGTASSTTTTLASSSSSSSSGTAASSSSSSSGTAASSSSSSSSSGSGSASASSSSSSGAAFTGTITANALTCPSNQCTIVPGEPGYMYDYWDGQNGAAGTSTVTIASGSACIAGTLGISSAATSYASWGAGIGFNIGASVGTGASASPAPYQLTGSGINIQVSSLPANGLRVVVSGPASTTGTVGVTDYCAAVPTSAATAVAKIPWSAFSTDCWDTTPTGGVLSAAPSTPHINVQAVSGSAASTFNFCVVSLGVAP